MKKLLNISVEPRLIERFKKATKENHINISSLLSGFIEEWTLEKEKKNNGSNLQNNK